MNSRRWGLAALFLSAVTICPVSLLSDASNLDSLAQGFVTPPDAAKPRVWWHWMNGNVTKEGIVADLEWMARVGIGGFQLFDVSLGDTFSGTNSSETPVFVKERVSYHSAIWKEYLRYAVEQARRLGLEVAINSAGGWGQTGGPWVEPEQAMKKLVWSKTRVAGPRQFSAVLPQPPINNGRFQDIVPEYQPTPDSPLIRPPLYGDSAVVAYRLPEREARMADRNPRLTTSSGASDLSILIDGKLNNPLALHMSTAEEKPVWISIEFDQPYSAQAISMTLDNRNVNKGLLEASHDGTSFFPVVSFSTSESWGDLTQQTHAFPQTTARYFRVSLDVEIPPALSASGRPLPEQWQFNISELELLSSATVHRWEEKAGFAARAEFDSIPTPPVAGGSTVPLADVIELTDKLDPNGNLTWSVPAGNWEILRLGYSLTGKMNHPAPLESTGYEVDKLNGEHLPAYFSGFVAPLEDALEAELGQTLSYVLMDSWEAGMQNWTENLLQEFQSRRGYDPTSFLPILTGRVIENTDISERFLWDFRRTIADLLADNYFKAAAEYLNTKGLGLYAEAAGTGSPMLQDALQNKGRVDIPMGEFWTPSPFFPPVHGQKHQAKHLMDIREAASASHIYGKQIVAAEAFTSFTPGWGEAPGAYKWLGDYFMTQGVNRFVIHTSAHQPFMDRKPGMSLGLFGLHYSRHNTWAEQSRAWITYLARSSHMLQQGLPVADLAYYYGEGVPASVYTGPQIIPDPAPPDGYAYDYFNTEVLLTRMSVKDGRVLLPDGMSYQALVIPGRIDKLRLPVVKKLGELVAAGASLVAARPGGLPGLSGYPDSDREFHTLTEAVWGDLDGQVHTQRSYGEGWLYWGRPLEGVLENLQTPPDLEYTRSGFDSEIAWTHRRLNDYDIYFLSNQQDRSVDIHARFRSVGKRPELWDPKSGKITNTTYRMGKARTTIPLRLAAHGSVFVVFGDKTAVKSLSIKSHRLEAVQTLEGSWQLSFPIKGRSKKQVEISELESWAIHRDKQIRYFSGTATYSRQLDIPASWLGAESRVELNLGEVREIAEVIVNGKAVEILWSPPFNVDITDTLRAGDNHLELKVTNLWANRLIGDVQPGAEPTSFTMIKAYEADAPLRDSGLLGPVRLLLKKRAEAD